MKASVVVVGFVLLGCAEQKTCCPGQTLVDDECMRSPSSMVPTDGTPEDLLHGDSSCNDDGSGTGIRPAPLRFTPIPIADDGWIDASGNPLGIQGWLYAKDDCEAATAAGLDCTQRDSSLVGPDGNLGWSFENGLVCVKGFEALVSDRAVQWGFEVGINLNQTRDGVPMPYDATKLKGFAVQIVGSHQPADLSFEVQMNDGADEYFTLVGAFSEAKARFGTLARSVTTQNPFDPAGVTSIALHPLPSSVGAIHYSFCITNFSALE